jgi:hypothetical protein
MQESAIDSALELLRPGLTADGFDLRLGSVDETGIVQVILEAGPAACQDCLVPEPVIIQILETAIRELDPSLAHVELVKSGFEATFDEGHPALSPRHRKP